MCIRDSNNIRLDSHTLQLFDRSLGWFGLHFAGCFQIRDQCDMDQYRIFMTDFMLELTDCLQERLTFNITDSTAGLYDGDMPVSYTHLEEYQNSDRPAPDPLEA